MHGCLLLKIFYLFFLQQKLNFWKALSLFLSLFLSLSLSLSLLIHNSYFDMYEKTLNVHCRGKVLTWAFEMFFLWEEIRTISFWTRGRKLSFCVILEFISRIGNAKSFVSAIYMLISINGSSFHLHRIKLTKFSLVHIFLSLWIYVYNP